MSADIMDLLPDGWTRDVYRDLAKLTEETGEVAEALVKVTKTTEDLAEELADVIACCFVLGLRRGIDMEDALRKKHKKRIEKRLNFYFNGERPKGWNPRVKY